MTRTQQGGRAHLVVLAHTLHRCEVLLPLLLLLLLRLRRKPVRPGSEGCQLDVCVCASSRRCQRSAGQVCGARFFLCKPLLVDHGSLRGLNSVLRGGTGKRGTARQCHCTHAASVAGSPVASGSTHSDVALALRAAATRAATRAAGSGARLLLLLLGRWRVHGGRCERWKVGQTLVRASSRGGQDPEEDLDSPLTRVQTCRRVPRSQPYGQRSLDPPTLAT